MGSLNVMYLIIPTSTDEALVAETVPHQTRTRAILHSLLVAGTVYLTEQSY